MFDNALPKTKRSFRFGDISVAVRLVDDDPGAVQVRVVGGGWSNGPENAAWEPFLWVVP